MKRWVAGLLAVALACVPILLSRPSGQGLLQDSDTQALLQAVRERQSPLSWFADDWPLGNHFYRPVSTLTFELDNALWGDNAAGYGLTNALLCVFAVFALFWFLREFTDKVEVATLSALLFALWHLGWGSSIAPVAAALAYLSFLCGLLPGRRLLPVLGGFAVWWTVGAELPGVTPLGSRLIDWLPGRTASVMTVFALLSLAAYCRYERISAPLLPKPPPGPLDPPATKGTALRPALPRFPASWAVAALVLASLALASYEQAVMLPALFTGVALHLRWRGLKVRWGWVAGAWALLGGYLALRAAVIPTDVSGYQLQQFRSGPGVLLSLGAYALPFAQPLYYLFNSLDLGIEVLLLPTNLYAILGFISMIVAYAIAFKKGRLPLAGWALSLVAFLPMAWMKHFDHYHYLPMAMRAIFVAAMVFVGFDALVSAASRPAIQAPLRPDPAPGSLPRP